jgi:hypothetical protein
MAKNHPRKRAHTLVFEGGEWRWLPRHVRRERQKKKKTRAHLAPAPAAAAIVVVVGGERRWWWHLQLQVVSPSQLSSIHLQLQVLSSSPSWFVDACSCRWCRHRRRRPFTCSCRCCRRRRCRPFTCRCRCCHRHRRRHRRRLRTPAAAGSVAVFVRSHLQPQVWSPLSSVGTDMVVGGERRWWWW